jgi:1-acyl-sn-glycerol-3-phosphate acyltransferase
MTESTGPATLPAGQPGAAGPLPFPVPTSQRVSFPAYRRLRWLVRVLVRIFFQRVEVAGLENIPRDRGGILVAWHPNGLVDPALILSAFPFPVVFGARSGLFRMPLLGRLIAALGTVPIYRPQDAGTELGESVAADEERRRRNDASLDALAVRIAEGSFSALFPEGLSHDAPKLQQLKTGAARLYYRARSLTPPGRLTPLIVPVGLHYDQKRVFRSGALVVFHPPLQLPPELEVSPAPSEHPDRLRDLARDLTTRMESELRTVVLETESWEVHQLLHRARKLIRAERAARAGVRPAAPSMEEKVLGLARVWHAYQERAAARPAEVAALRKRMERYHRDLEALGVEDHELDRPPPVFRPWLWVILLSQLLSVFLLLPPFLLAGYVINLPTAWLLARWAEAPAREGKDVASYKLIGGTLMFPVTWALWSWFVGWGSAHPRTRALLPWLPHEPFLAAGAMLLIAIVGAILMLVYAELARATWRAVRVRLTRGLRARAFLRLRLERARLCDALLAMADGLELPGTVWPDGTIGPS